jgi:RimJ/RimL family protein N-acetyltransferase
VRLESDAEGWRIDYSVAREFRGKRLAATMLGMAVDDLRRRSPAGRVFAEVKAANARSRQVLVSLGFVEHGDSRAGVVVYKLSWGQA